MPARHHIVAIVVFWLATSGWLFYRELWPKLRPGEPPPFTIEQVDEARQQPIRWTIYQAEAGHDGRPKEMGWIDTRVTYRERGETYRWERGEPRTRDEAVDRPRDDTYELSCKAKFTDVGFDQVQVIVEDTYRIVRDGDLREIVADVTITFARLEVFKGHVEGSVRDGRFIPQGWTDRLNDREQHEKRALTMDPVPLPGRGSLMNQLHPVNRMPGLHLEQHWRVPLFDPLHVALSDASSDDPLIGPLLILVKTFGKSKQFQPRELEAEVRSERQTLMWDGRDESCLVIDYRAGDQLVASTWVRARDGLVLQQEATVMGKSLLLKRMPIK
jgi:hypothetical protein